MSNNKFGIPDNQMGSMDDGMVSDTDTWTKVIENKSGQKFGFELKEPTYVQVQQALSDNTSADGSVDSVAYAVDILEEMIVDATVDAPITFVNGMNQHLGQQLFDEVPMPGAVDEELEGN